MKLWRRRKPREVEATSESYALWLRAQRPPLPWFLEQPRAAQEMLAELGDEYVRSVCLETGYAVADPAVAEAGMNAATNVDAESVLLQKLTDTAAAGLQRPTPSSNPPNGAPALSMGGITERRRAADEARQRGKDNGRSLFGRPPDGGGE